MEKIQKEERLNRYLDNLYTRQDVEGLLESIDDNEQLTLMKEASEILWEESAFRDAPGMLNRQRYHQEAEALLNKLQPVQNPPRRKLTTYRRSFTVAASAVIVCTFIWSMLYLLTIEREIILQEVVTDAGEKQTLTLPDGSTLVINACSRLRYPQTFTGDTRQIYLDGEAYFQVVNKKDLPFIVTTSTFDVTVLGTSFNIKSYEGDESSSVSVESGRVQVDLPEAMLRLSQSEELTFHVLTDEFHKQRKEGEVAPWIKGGLRFTRTPIRDVAKELERVYNCRITFQHGQEFNNHISGEHENSSLEAVLQSIEYISGIRYRISGNEILLYK